MTSIVDQICSSEKRLIRIPALLEILRDTDFINEIMKQVKTAFPKGNPPLSLVLSQISSFLKEDYKINGILQNECETGFLEREEYHTFIFTFGLYVYVQYVRIHSNVNQTGGNA